MNIKEIAVCIRSGSEIKRAITCLANFDSPLKERELQVLQTYRTSLETALPNDPAPSIDHTILERPTEIISRPVVFSLIMSTIRLSTVRYDIKKALVSKVLPDVILCTFMERMAKRQAELEWYAVTYAANKNPDAAKKATLLHAHNTAVALVDVDSLEKELGQVNAHQWNVALKMLISKGDWHFEGFLRCVEYILVILNQKASCANNNEVNFAEEVKKSFTDSLGKLLVSVCERRVVKRKKDTRGVGNTLLPLSSKRTFNGISNIRRLVYAFQSKNGEESFALKAVNEVINCHTADSSDSSGKCLYLAPFAIFAQMIDMKMKSDDVKPIKHDIFNYVITKNPGVVSCLLGSAPPSGSIVLSQSQDSIQSLFYTLGLSSTNWHQARDIFSLLQALPTTDLAAYCKVNLSNTIDQLYSPFVNNLGVFSVSRAPFIASSYARAFVPASGEVTCIPDEESWKVVCQCTQKFLLNRCRSGEDRIGVLTVFAALLNAQSSNGHFMPEGSMIFNVVKSNLESGVIEVRGRCWAALATVKGGCNLSKGHAALNNMTKNQDSLLMCLLNAASDFTEGDDTWRTIQSQSAEFEVFRPNAFLSLRFYHPTSASELNELVKRVSTAEVLRQLTTSSEGICAAKAAINIAKLAHQYYPLAMMLTHPSGEARFLCKSFILNELADDLQKMMALWTSMTENVFGLNDTQKPEVVCQSFGGDALVVVASSLLRHSGELSITTLAEMLLCCGHDNVVGHDPFYFTFACNLIGHHSSVNCSLVAFDAVFTNNNFRLLNREISGIVAVLCRHLTAPDHLATAAGRALAMILSRHSARRSADEAVKAKTAANIIFGAIKVHLEKGVKFFDEQSEMDRIISSSDHSMVQEYVLKRCKEEGLIKEYFLNKLPKGMTIEDVESQKKKDDKALELGKDKVFKEIVKRKSQITADINKNLSGFFALRTIGNISHIAIEGLPIVYPFIHSTLASDISSPASKRAAISACRGLLRHSPLSGVDIQLVTLSSRLANPLLISLSSQDVSEVVAIASHMRIHCTAMMPPAMFSVLLPFTKGAFKVGKEKMAKFIPPQTQHQLLSILSMNAAQPEILQKSEACSFFINIIPSFPTLYRSIQSGLGSLVTHCSPECVNPVIRATFLGNDLQRECAFYAFSKFGHFATVRRSVVVVLCMINDSSNGIVHIAKTILKGVYELEEADLMDLIGMLEEFGHNPNALTSISATIVQLVKSFPSCQHSLISQLTNSSNRNAVVVTLGSLAPHMTTECIVSTLKFLCDIVEEVDSTAVVLHSALKAGREILNHCDVEVISAVAHGIHPRLKKPVPKEFKQERREIHSAIAVVWLTIIACKMNDTTFLEDTITQQQSVLDTSSTAMVHGFVQESMYEISRNAKMRHHTKIEEFVQYCLKHAISTGQYVRKRAFVAGVIGVCQGIGLRSIRRFNIIDVINEGIKGNQSQQSGAFVIIEALADGLGSSFDPYALSLIQFLLTGVGNKDSKVSECADDAAKAVMRNLSEAGLRQLIPKLVTGLMSDQTKTRTPSLSFIGYVAFCSPKQLAHTLPQIMTHICSCLFDVNSSVSNAAFVALKRVAGVISNREIQEHVDVLLAAMRSPTTDTDKALDALLYTRFMTAVDPASLALVVPVLNRGLVDVSPASKGKASQIVSAMSHLVSDKRSLVPYSEELLKKMQMAAQHPQNEVRNTAAKAIASLSSTIKGDLLAKAFDWCFTLLQRAQSTAEKAGAAQVMMEIVHDAGKHLLFDSIDRISQGIRHPDCDVRDGYMHIMIYAPPTLHQDVFQDFLNLSFPWVLLGLSDPSEKVRTTALTAGSNIIVLYGSRNLSLVLKPLLDGVLSEDSNQRQSSLILTSKLLIHIVTQIRKKIRMAAIASSEETADFENDDGQEDVDPNDEDADILQGVEIHMETARDAEKRGVSIIDRLEDELGTENFMRVLGAMHIGRNEVNSNVRTEVAAAWQVAVPSARTVIAKIFPHIVRVLVKFASSNNADCVEVAVKNIEYTCARLNESVETFIQLLAEQYHIGTNMGSENPQARRQHIGAIVCMSEVIPYAGDSHRVMALGGSILGCVSPALQSENDDIRSCAGVLFMRLSKLCGARLIEGIVESQIDTSIVGVLEVVKVRPGAALDVIFRIFKNRTVFTSDHMELLMSLLEIEATEKDIIQHFETMITIILKAIEGHCEGSLDAMTALAGYLTEEYCQMPLMLFKKAVKYPDTKLTAVLAAGAYAKGVSLGNPEYIEEVYRVIIPALADSDAKISAAAAQLIIEMNVFIDQRVIAETLDDADSQDVTACRRAAGRYSLNFLDTIQQTLNATAHSSTTSENPEFEILSHPRLFDSIQGFYLRVLEHGLPAQRTQSIDALVDLLKVTPKIITSAAVSTISGKCSKALFTKQDGDVVASILRLCLTLLSYPAGGKERMVESTLAIAMIGALLCNNTSARTLVHRVIIVILKRNPVQAAAVLGSVVSKKSVVDTPVLKGAVCRFVSVVMRHGKLEKRVEHTNTILNLIRPWWENPEVPSLGAAAGSAIGALCMNAAVPDEEVASLCDKAIALVSGRSARTQGGVAAIYSLVVSSESRIDTGFCVSAAEAVRGAVAFVSNDRISSLWILRCASAFRRFPETSNILTSEVITPLLKRITDSDELMLSVSQLAIETVPGCRRELIGGYPAKSTAWLDLDNYDADVEDESQSDTFY